MSAPRLGCGRVLSLAAAEAHLLLALLERAKKRAGGGSEADRFRRFLIDGLIVKLSTLTTGARS